MPIIKQLNATKFRSLKYGNDTSDGGSSRQPYMRVELKDLDKPINRLRLTKFDDGLVRGGAVGALNAAAVDTLRIGKFFKDLPKGPLFLIKQVGLQLSNPRLEFKKVGGGAVGGIGPTRLYNLGINTLAQVSLNAFGGHLVRHGLLPVMNDNTKYLSVVTDNNKFSEDNLDSQNNRLVGLRNKFDLGDGEVEYSITLKDAIATNRQNNRDGRQANREFNRDGRQANRSLNKMGRKINREDNRDIRKYNRGFNRESRKINRQNNRQGRQNNRLVNQSTREGARVEGFEFTRSKFERTSYEPTNLEQTKFERSVFHRSSFKRNKINISDYTIDNYLGGPGSVYGIGRTIINRYNFTEDKIKIDQAFENARIETIRGSLLVNPLTEQSAFADASGSYITGATVVPFIDADWVWDDWNNEEDQFKALSRKKQPGSFYYTVGNIAESKLQKAIGDGNINTSPQDPDWSKSTIYGYKTFGTGHVPKIDPTMLTSPEQFKAIKRSLLWDSEKKIIKFYDEDPEYIGGTRDIVTFSKSTKNAVDGLKDAQVKREDFTTTGKTLEEAQSKMSALTNQPAGLDYFENDPGGTTLKDVGVTASKVRKKKTVKASIIDVKGFERENKLETIYNNGEMVSSPLTSIIQETSGDDIFKTEDLIINRDTKNFRYLAGGRTMSAFDRFDPDIMSVHFNSIDPFTATNLSSIWFSAYMSGFKYGTSATWNPVKYVGRSESFYTFTEHKRDVSFNLQIPCFNETELLENHSKLSELQSVLAGKYSPDNRLGGIITAITLGSYLVGEPGILTSVSFDIPDTSSWDLDFNLAMYLNAQFSFIVIGKELPEFRKGGFFFGKPQPKSEPPKTDPAAKEEQKPKTDATKGDSEQKIEKKKTDDAKKKEEKQTKIIAPKATLTDSNAGAKKEKLSTAVKSGTYKPTTNLATTTKSTFQGYGGGSSGGGGASGGW
jgi:hypothetical protein